MRRIHDLVVPRSILEVRALIASSACSSGAMRDDARGSNIDAACGPWYRTESSGCYGTTSPGHADRSSQNSMCGASSEAMRCASASRWRPTIVTIVSVVISS
jgi:hypothetical protein